MKPLQPSSPHVIAMVGMPGAGKTQFANEFSAMFKAPLISTAPFEELTNDTRQINELAFSLIGEFLKTHQTIVLDGAMDQRTMRIRLNKLAREHGYKVLLIWVQTDPVTAQSRWMKLYGGDEAAFERRLKQFSAPHDSESYVVISGRHTFSTQARTVLKRLSAPRIESARVNTAHRTYIG